MSKPRHYPGLFATMGKFLRVSRIFSGLLFLAAMAGAPTLRADFITLQNITGNNDAIHAEFNVVWGALTNPTSIQGSLNGNWPDGGPGTWSFSASVTNLASPNSEGFDSYIFSTVWNDGWTPFGVQASDFFVFGLGNGRSTIHNNPPIVNFLYTDSHGLTYLFNATLTGTRQANADTTGSSLIFLDLSRTAVPEPKSTSFLVASFCLLAVWRGAKIARGTKRA